MSHVLLCPYCSAPMSVADELLGQLVQCPTCRVAFPTSYPVPPPIQAGVASSTSSRPDAPSATLGQQAARTAIRWGLIGLVAGVGFGALASQYFPWFGGFLVQIAIPFSPPRLQALPTHCLMGGIGGALIFAGLAALIRYAAFGVPSNPPIPNAMWPQHQRRFRRVFHGVAVSIGAIVVVGILLVVVGLISLLNQRRLDEQSASAAAPRLLKMHADELPHALRSSNLSLMLLRVEVRPWEYQDAEVGEYRNAFNGQRLPTMVYVDRIGTAADAYFDVDGQELKMAMLRKQGETKWKFVRFHHADR